MALLRELEPEVMDTFEEAIEYDEMDHSAVNAQFAKDFLATGIGAGEVLDLGTGTARIPIEICRRSPSLRFVAADLAISMLDLARRNIEIASMRERILPAHIDAKGLSFTDGRFDAVISNSIVHHIPEPVHAMREAMRVCRAGGMIFFRDLCRPHEEEDLERTVQLYAGNESPHAQTLLRQSLRAALTVAEMQERVAACGLSHEDVSMTSDRHWTWISRIP